MKSAVLPCSVLTDVPETDVLSLLVCLLSSNAGSLPPFGREFLPLEVGGEERFLVRIISLRLISSLSSISISSLGCLTITGCLDLQMSVNTYTFLLAVLSSNETEQESVRKVGHWQFAVTKPTEHRSGNAYPSRYREFVCPVTCSWTGHQMRWFLIRDSR